MRTPDQDERPDPGTAGSAGEALGDGFGSVDQGDLNDGYGSHDFYDDSYDDPTDVADDTYDTDATFDDAADDDGGFGGSGPDGGVDDGSGVGEVVPVGNEVSDADAENILVDILDDVFGDDADEVVDEMETAYGMDASELLEALGDGYATDDDGGLSPVDTSDDGGVFDNPFDPTSGTTDVGDAADFATQSDFDLNADGQVNHGDLQEAAHPFDFHVDGG
jgi:hypothetical protein